MSRIYFHLICPIGVVVSVLLLSLSFILVVPAYGASFTVNSTLDLPDGTPGDGICLTSPPLSVCTLRAAIMETNALPGADTINLGVDTYLLTRAAVIPDDEANGDLDIRDDLTINGVTSDLSIIDGNGVDRVLEINGGGVPGGIRVDLFNLTVKNGDVSGEGGGIRTYIADVTLTNVKVLDNQASSNGGGIYSQGPLVLDNVRLQGNQAILTGGGLQNIVGSTITNSVISGNQVTASWGGGAGIYTIGDLEINQSMIQTNTSSGVGGGIFVEAGTTTVTDTIIEGNVAGNGGGVFGSNGFINLDGVTLASNQAVGGTGSGGAVSFSGSGTLNLINSTVSGNQAEDDGGGIKLYEGTINLVNVTIVGNVADQDAIFGGDGGGLNNELGTMSLLNTILAGNTASTSPNNGPDCFGTLNSLGFNLVQTLTADCTLSGTMTGNLIGVNPLLGPLADNGGFSKTHAPLSGSPVIDAGTNSGCPTIDQRGYPRPVDANLDGSVICDIGAYEKLIDLFLPLIMR